MKITARIVLGLAATVTALILGFTILPKTAHADPSGNIYNLNAFPLQQITGSPGPGTVSQPPFAAAITIGTNQEYQGLVQQIVGVNSVSATSTVTAGSGGQFGQFLVVICSATQAGGGNVTYTFATPLFLPTATVVATQGKSITVCWVSDGSFWHEFCRSASAQ